jgi:membrane protease subunit (stomatin/prohibitin family)
MNNDKDIDITRIEYDEKIQSIKKRKRSLKMLQDPDMIKRIKKDLEREKRAAKRGDKNNIKKYIKDEIEKYGK